MHFSSIKAIDEKLELVSPGDWSSEMGDITGISNIESPREKEIIFLKNSKIFKKLGRFDPENSSKNYQQTAVIATPQVWAELSGQLKDFAFVSTTTEIDLTICRLSKFFYDKKCGDLNNFCDGRQIGSVEIDPSSYLAQNVFIGENVQIGKNVRILPGSVILSHVKIDDNSTIFSNVTIYPFVNIGKNCIVHAGVVIGADGFSFHFAQGVHHKIWHMGGVMVGDNVEVGANSAIDGGTFSPTIIGSGSKIDNLVQIGHNCKLGAGVIICGHVAIGGSSIIGDYSVFGGKAGMGHGISIGAGCQVAGGAMVNGDWPDGALLGGHPARPLKEWMRGLAYLRKESLRK